MSQSELQLSYQQFTDIFSLTKTATALHLGEDAVIYAANDAMLKVWGKDKSVIGKSLGDALPELVGQPFIDMFKRVWLEGLVISGSDTPADLEIDGEIKTVYFDFEYRAVKDTAGKTICVLHSAIDVTDRYLQKESRERIKEKEEALQREQALNEELAASIEELESVNEELKQSQESLNQINNDLEERVQERTLKLLSSNDELAAINEEMHSTNEQLLHTQESLENMIIGLAESDARFQSLVKQAPIAITVLKTENLLIDIVNNKMLEIWGKDSDVQGQPLAIAMPELQGQPFLTILQDVIKTGKPYFGYESHAFIIRNGERVEGYFNFICQPVKNGSGVTDSVLQVVTEITDQVTARLKVQKAEEMTRMAIEAAQLGSWNIEPVTKALQYNDTLARIFGYEGIGPMTYEQAINQVTEEYRDKILTEIDKAVKLGGNYDFTYSQRRFNDDEIVWLRSSGKISQDDQGAYTIFSGVVMDITEQKRDEIRKNDFIGMVSHELKTPLTSLSAYMQMLQLRAKKADDAFTTAALDQSVKQVKRMTTMINGFLNVSRLESGKIHIEKNRFNMADLVKETEEETIALYASHQIIFHPVEPIFVNADRDKIGQVINNFISNAIKYSKLGTTVQVACISVNGMAQVSVKDEGIGIGEADIKQLFTRYYRVQNYDTKHISGFGIGLYLSAEIIERHQGSIWVESEAEKGSTFYFTIPLS